MGHTYIMPKLFIVCLKCKRHLGIPYFPLLKLAVRQGRFTDEYPSSSLLGGHRLGSLLASPGAAFCSAGAPLGGQNLSPGGPAEPDILGPGSLCCRTAAGAAFHAGAHPDCRGSPGQEVRGGLRARHMLCCEDGPSTTGFPQRGGPEVLPLCRPFPEASLRGLCVSALEVSSHEPQWCSCRLPAFPRFWMPINNQPRL